jgi:hypothetical protein
MDSHLDAIAHAFRRLAEHLNDPRISDHLNDTADQLDGQVTPSGDTPGLAGGVGVL